jgi:hypothetical protein
MRAQQLTTGYYTPAQTSDISTLINQILPVVMLAMVFAMVVPMFKGLTRGISD